MANQFEINQLVDHLFRHESGKMIAVLTRIFGSENLELAEDVVQDSLIEAIKQWEYKGIPDNPSGWLFRVAKNKAINIVNREKYKRQYSADATQWLQSEWTVEHALNFFFSEQEIIDDQLRMMFTCCHPSISSDSQVALTLKTLCGFSIAEIAKAFFTSEENINKRLVRARQKIRENHISFEVPNGKELENRLQVVLETIYLLFNEGYSASTGKDLIRYEICEEAIRLAEIIASHSAIQNKSTVYALLALMQLNASRFEARQDAEGNILTLEHQNRSLWNFKLMGKGFSNLEKFTADKEISIYHILATISAYHCSAANYQSTDWESILSLYNQLIQIDSSAVVLLNRAVALSKVSGPKIAILELEQLKNTQSIKTYHLFYSVLAEFHIQMLEFDKAADVLGTAIALAPLEAERSFLQRRLTYCREKVF
ncbi:MAG TPA: sigma-70 family RNA polymerase sigma factor [Flavipsychrobacter sp.]|nr:sigma-70 family RNA polymerase sigma factor [Flavipsychrobacter sp.]